MRVTGTPAGTRAIPFLGYPCKCSGFANLAPQPTQPRVTASHGGVRCCWPFFLQADRRWHRVAFGDPVPWPPEHARRRSACLGDLAVVDGHGEDVRDEEDADTPGQGDPDVGADRL